MVPFLYWEIKTAEGAERSPSDLDDSKRSVAGKTTKTGENGSEGQIGSLSYVQHYDLGRWITSASSRGLFYYFPFVKSVLTI